MQWWLLFFPKAWSIIGWNWSNWCYVRLTRWMQEWLLLYIALLRNCHWAVWLLANSFWVLNCHHSLLLLFLHIHGLVSLCKARIIIGRAWLFVPLVKLLRCSVLGLASVDVLFTLQMFLQVIIVHFEQLFLAWYILVDNISLNLSTRFDREVLNLFEFNRFLTFRMTHMVLISELTVWQRAKLSLVIYLITVQHSMFTSIRARPLRVFTALRQYWSLMASLAFEISFLTFVLHNLRNLWSAIRLSGVMTVSFWWAWSLLLKACPFCGVMALAKDFVYGCAMQFIRSKLHLIIVLNSIVEGCLMIGLMFHSFQDETWISTLCIINELLPVHRADSLRMLWVCEVGGYHWSWCATLVANLTQVPLAYISTILTSSGTTSYQLTEMLLRKSIRHSSLNNFLGRLVMLWLSSSTCLWNRYVSSILTLPPISAYQLFHSSV